MGNLSKEALESLEGLRISLREKEIVDTLATTRTHCEQFVMQAPRPLGDSAIQRYVTFYQQPLDNAGQPIETPLTEMGRVDVGVILNPLAEEIQLRVDGLSEYLEFLGRQPVIRSISPNGYTPGGEILRSANNVDAGFWGRIAQQLPI